MELWDVLDKNGNKTGKIVDYGIELEDGEYRLLIDVWVINKNKEFLISKRIATKQPYPNKWNPVCGSVIAGENSITAALRETKEELGINLDAQNGRLLKRFSGWKNAIIDVWLFSQEVDYRNIVLQKEETDEVIWATSVHIKDLVDNNDFICHERIPYIDELLMICES
jgi:isopentenyldiphosphate isomerase